MRVKRLAPLLAATLCCLASASAAERGALELPKVEVVAIDQLLPGPGDEDAVELTLRVLGREGEPIDDLRTADLRVWQSDEPIDRGDLALQRFAESGRTLSSVFVIDRRPTHEQEAFARSIETARNFVERAGRGEEVAVIAFGGTVEVVVPFGTPPRDAVKTLEGLQRRDGGTAGEFFGAIVQAIEMLRAKSRHADGFVVLLTPGIGAGGGVMKVVDASMGKEREAKIPVFALAPPTAAAAGVAALRNVAEGTSGRFTEAEPRDFNSEVNRIWRVMSGRYVLRFPAPMDGRRHRVDVEIEGVLGSAKAGYPVRSTSIPWAAIGIGALALVGILAVVSFALSRRPRPPRLVVLNGAQAGNVIPLAIGTHRIGSLPTNQIHLASPGVSRHHAEIVVSETSVQIRDLQSKNGTRVNGSLREVSPLLPGDRLEFADVRMVFESGPATKRRRTSEL